jgi:hypothetical protein
VPIYLFGNSNKYKIPGKTIKLTTPTSKNIPVNSVLKKSIRFQETSFSCQSMKTTRSIADKSRNPLIKFHSKENLEDKEIVKLTDDFNFMTVYLFANLTLELVFNWNSRLVLSES